jgi:nitroimidazol reductase NimA-like FMN-containing flavoprotein (pyridoxamine 5'-phosphate oxidase superfamily)
MTAEKDLADCPEPPSRQLQGPGAARQRAIRALSVAECLELLEPGGIGRVGLTSVAGVVILPVNFAVTRSAIIFRTAPDTLLAMRTSTRISFEADHIDEARQAGWSVLVQGHARIVIDEPEIRRLERTVGLEPWAGGARDVWVRITPVRISGRRIRPSGPGETVPR